MPGLRGTGGRPGYPGSATGRDGASAHDERNWSAHARLGKYRGSILVSQGQRGQVFKVVRRWPYARLGQSGNVLLL